MKQNCFVEENCQAKKVRISEIKRELKCKNVFVKPPIFFVHVPFLQAVFAIKVLELYRFSVFLYDVFAHFSMTWIFQNRINC